MQFWMILLGTILLICRGMTSLAHADNVDDYIKTQMKEHPIPGLSLAVVREGKVVKAKGYGLANLEGNTTPTPATVYQLASLTKPFTATAVLLLVQDGKLRVDDTLGTYVNGTPESWNGVTLRHLLTHTSGIPEYLDESPDSPTASVTSRAATTPAQIIQSVAVRPLDFAPGEKYRYSNTNYLLLALVVRRVTGLSYDRFLAERVFRPLQMTATRLTSDEDVIANRAAGYTWTGSKWKNSPALEPTLWDNGDGGIVSTVLDLAKWDAALAGGALLTEETQEQMGTPARLNDGTTAHYCFGWGIGSVRGRRCLWHAGGRPGTSTAIARFVDDKVTVIVLMNCDNVRAIEIAHRVAGFYIPALAPPVYRPIRDREPRVTERVKALLQAVAQGASSPLPPRIPMEIDGFRTPIRSASDLLSSLRSLGEVQSIALVERKDVGENRLYRYRVRYKNARLLVGLWLDREEKIVRAAFQRE